MPEYGTTDRLTGGTPSADSIYSAALNEAKACDNSGATYWSSGEALPMPHWWKYDFGAGVAWKISKAIITPQMISSGNGIKNFNIQRSPDNSNWTTICTGITVNNGNAQTFTFENNNSNRYIIINIIDNWDGTYPVYARITEIEMFEGIYPGGFFVFLSEAFERNKKLWQPKLLLPTSPEFQI